MFAKSRILLSFLFALCALCVLCGPILGQDFKILHNGVEYAQFSHKLGTEPVKINLLRLDLTKVRLDVHHALDKAIGLETTSSIARRKGAVAAINAGFFRLDKSVWAGDATGLLMVDGMPLSESYNDRIIIGIHNGKKTSVDFAHVRSVINLKVNNDLKVGVINGVDRSRLTNDVVVYSSNFGKSSLTSNEGLEIIVEQGRVADIQINKGSSTIPAGGFVISASGSSIDKFSTVRAGDKVSLITGVVSANEGGVTKAKGMIEDITNGVPQLIKNGKVDITWEQEKASKSFVETRHPRTAVAKMKDGKFLMITVDGRQPGVSVGMSLYELADYLLSIGAVDAMNLDGGGSTTMFLDGKVVNTPSDKEGERKVGDVIVVTLRKKK